MSQARWKHICQVRNVVASQEKHAVWVARHVARHIETFKISGRWVGYGHIWEGHIASTKDALALLEGNNLFSRVLSGYQVAPALRDVCMQNVRKFAAAKFMPKEPVK